MPLNKRLNNSSLTQTARGSRLKMDKDSASYVPYLSIASCTLARYLPSKVAPDADSQELSRRRNILMPLLYLGLMKFAIRLFEHFHFGIEYAKVWKRNLFYIYADSLNQVPWHERNELILKVLDNISDEHSLSLLKAYWCFQKAKKHVHWCTREAEFQME